MYTIYHNVLSIILCIAIIIVGFYLYYISKILNSKQLTFVHTRLKNMLSKFTHLLYKYEYQYFIQGGTLLGCIRDGNIIEHDDDIDLGMMEDDIQHMLNNNKFMDELRRNNLDITLPRMHCYKIRYIKNPNENDKSTIFLDLFSYSIFESNVDSNENIIHYTNRVSRMQWPNGWFYVKEFYPLKIGHLDNIPVVIPNQSIEYFKRHYGEDWETPKKTHSHGMFLNLDKNCYGECFIFK